MQQVNAKRVWRLVPHSSLTERLGAGTLEKSSWELGHDRAVQVPTLPHRPSADYGSKLIPGDRVVTSNGAQVDQALIVMELEIASHGRGFSDG